MGVIHVELGVVVGRRHGRLCRQRLAVLLVEDVALRGVAVAVDVDQDALARRRLSALSSVLWLTLVSSLQWL